MAGATGPVRRLGANLGHLARLGVGRAVLTRRAPFWLLVRMAPPFEEIRSASFPLARDRSPGLLETLRALDAARSDPRVAGVLLRPAGAPHGLAAAQALRRAVDAVREAGKPVAAYAERIDAPEYWVVSGAAPLWMPETGTLHLVGLRTEAIYLRRVLDRFDIEPDVVRVGSHKTAAEALTREGMSQEQREQLDAYLDDVYDGLVGAIASGRSLEAGSVRDRIDRGPYGARAAVEAGLVDACRFPDEVEETLAELAPDTRGDRGRARLVDAATYEALHASDPGWRPLLRDLPRIAYVTASGPIRREGGPLRAGVSVEGLRALLERLRHDDGVRGVVLRLASPGGDALASDLLWRGLRVMQQDKPVVVSMGEVAASGGYLAAVAAGTVLAEEATVTGSIGVVGGKVNLEGLYERIGLGRDGIERGKRAGMLSDARGFTADERAAVRAEMETVYDVFLRRVEAGRPLERAEIERAAQGRIWSGRRALALRLVDLLGGPLEALREVRARAGIAEGERVQIDVHPRFLPPSALRGLLGLDAVRLR